MDDTYRDWAVRIQAAQAKYPGYRRLYLQPPAEKDGFWTTFIRYDTTEHLEAWMKAPERRELLKESQAFIERETTFVTMPLSIRWFGWWLFTEKKDAGLDHAGRPRIPYNPLCHRAFWHLLPW
jgi:antibiotic biosynthesis monooxygenase (ABM) superfamily enzyme